MKDRCNNHNNKLWHRYGGRGIRVEPPLDNVEAYITYVETVLNWAPGLGWTIDRINNNGNYAIGNLRLATKLEQGRNKGNNHRVTYGGELVCLSQAAEMAGLSYAAVRSRIIRGWGEEDALSKPIRGGLNLPA